LGRLSGKTALVTGASRGIGRATALRLGAEGALVGVHFGHSEAKALTAVAEIEGSGGQAFALGADLRQTSSIKPLVESLCRELSRRTGDPGLDILVNNAGIGPRLTLEETTEEVLDAVLQINLKAPFLLTQALSPVMREGGRIVNLSSMASRTAFPAFAAYAPSKAAVESLTLLLAAHFGPRRITVNAVSPGATSTDMNPAASDPGQASMIARTVALGRVGEPDDMASVIAFLASDDARWITGEVIQVTGGQRLV
jgi:3-oxoacyl-[acyl-carrier protein] reductase